MMTREDYRRGAENLLQWLAALYDTEGAYTADPGNIQFYYKLPAVFSYGGRRELALKTLAQFQKRFLADGVLSISADPIAAPWAAYLAGWLSWGAAALGRFDLARESMAGVLPLQDRQLGGFVHDSPLGPLLDTERSASAGMGLVWTMEIEAAKSTARYLERMLDQQPEKDIFHAYLSPEGRIVPDRADRNACFDLADEHARPALFATAIAFLVWLGRITGDPAHFHLAARYNDLILSHRKDSATLPLATKTGWTSLMVAKHVDRAAYLDFAHRVGADLLSRQQSDGAINFDAVPDVPKPVDKVWLVGWGCDAALTLCALADGEA